MTPPRQIRPGQACFVTVRAVNRSFRFVPTRDVRATILYCFAITMAKYRGRIAIHEFLWMSNHYHLVLTDVDACLPSFMEELNSLLSRALNALRNVTGTNIEKGYSLVTIETENRLFDHCVYTLANPCAAHLVRRCRHWKGVSSFGLDYGVPVQVRRPSVGLWAKSRPASSASSLRRKGARRSKLPDVVDLVLERPDLRRGSTDEELRRSIREHLGRRERELIDERRRRGLGVLGWKAVVVKSFWAVPSGAEERSTRLPTHSADQAHAGIKAVRRRRTFLATYYRALERFVRGDRTVLFPEGTWLMKIRYGVICCPLPAT